MAQFDLAEADLRAYSPRIEAPADFVTFWDSTIAEARQHRQDVLLIPTNSRLRGVDVVDLTFPGFGGEPIKAWYLRPAGTDQPLPTVVEFVGYGGGRGLPHERLAWPVAGFAYVVADTRGQGSGWGGGGATRDPHGTGPSSPGFMTRGIEDPGSYYYRRVYTDAYRCVDAVRALPGVDNRRIAVAGGSQGGGIALAVAGLRSDLAAAIIDVPFLCHFARAVAITDRDPYAEITRYLSIHHEMHDQVFRTLSYFDGANFAPHATAPATFSTGLRDQTCPPSTVFAAYNRYGGDKRMSVYPFNDHEGGAARRWPTTAGFLAEVLGEPQRG